MSSIMAMMMATITISWIIIFLSLEDISRIRHIQLKTFKFMDREGGSQSILSQKYMTDDVCHLRRCIKKAGQMLQSEIL
jgi:hypothetical protein